MIRKLIYGFCVAMVGIIDVVSLMLYQRQYGFLDSAKFLFAPILQGANIVDYTVGIIAAIIMAINLFPIGLVAIIIVASILRVLGGKFV